MALDEQERLEQVRFRRLKLLSKTRKASVDAAVLALLKHVQGRTYLYWLLEICQIGRQPFTANALTTSFQCGELNVGQQIQSHIIEVSPEGYLQMLKEKQEEQESARRNSTDSDHDTGANAAADASADT